MTEIKALDTIYNGNYFRSRLEARWAYFFDLIEVKYLYEPQRFSNGVYTYLPDFFLYNSSRRNDKDGLYIEIKPESFTAQTIPEAKWFNKSLVLFNGPPNLFIHTSNNHFEPEGGFEIVADGRGEIWDNCQRIYLCGCGHLKTDFADGSYEQCHVCGKRHAMIDLSEFAVKSILKRFERHELKSSS